MKGDLGARRLSWSKATVNIRFLGRITWSKGLLGRISWSMATVYEGYYIILMVN